MRLGLDHPHHLEYRLTCMTTGAGKVISCKGGFELHIVMAMAALCLVHTAVAAHESPHDKG